MALNSDQKIYNLYPFSKGHIRIIRVRHHQHQELIIDQLGCLIKLCSIFVLFFEVPVGKGTASSSDFAKMCLGLVFIFLCRISVSTKKKQKQRSLTPAFDPGGVGYGGSGKEGNIATSRLYFMSVYIYG